MTSPSSAGVEEPKEDAGTLALAQWEATRRVWLEPRARSSISRSSPSKSVKDPSSSTGKISSRSGAEDDSKKDIETREKFRVAFERMILCYDDDSKLDREKDVAKRLIIRTADQLTHQDRVFLSPIPLGHAVGVLYRSWFHDGTIPDNYRLLPPRASTRSGSGSDTTSDDEDPSKVHHLSSCPSYPCPALVLRQPANADGLTGHSANFVSSSSSSSSFAPSSEDDFISSKVHKDSTSTKDIKLVKVYLTKP